MTRFSMLALNDGAGGYYMLALNDGDGGSGSTGRQIYVLACACTVPFSLISITCYIFLLVLVKRVRDMHN